MNHIVTEDNKNLRENKRIVKKRQTIVFFYSSQFDKVDQKTHNSVLMRAAEPRVVEDSGWLCSQITAHSFIFAPTSLYKTTAWVWPTLNRRGRIAISVFTGGYNTNERLSLQSVSDWKQTGVEERGETVHDLINRGWHFSDNNNSKVKHSESVHRVDINPGRSAQVKSTCGKHCIMKTLLITHCDGYIIMTPSVFRLVLSKPHFHSAVLSSTKYEIKKNYSSMINQASWHHFYLILHLHYRLNEWMSSRFTLCCWVLLLESDPVVFENTAVKPLGRYAIWEMNQCINWFLELKHFFMWRLPFFCVYYGFCITECGLLLGQI